MRGIGNNLVIPIGSATITIEICDVAESVDIYITDDNAIKYTDKTTLLKNREWL